MSRPDFTAADVQRVLIEHHALPPALAAFLRQFTPPEPQPAPVKRDWSFKRFNGEF